MKDAWIWKDDKGNVGKDILLNEHDIMPSLELTYLNMAVVITLQFDGSAIKHYDIRRPKKIGEERGELISVITFYRCHVHTTATHL